jgi:serine protease Do
MEDKVKTGSSVIFSLALAGILSGSHVALAQEPVAGLEAFSEAVQAAAEKVARSVVLIEVEREAPEEALSRAQMRRLGLLGQSPAEGYYQRPGGPVCGVVLDNSGTIVTAGYNLAGKVKRVTVIAADGRRRDAKILGRDPNMDVRLIQVLDAAGLEVPELGDSAALEPGRFVVSVARSEGTSGLSINSGIVSAVGRMRGQALQVSSRVNYGNAGCALVDLRGRLVGIIAQHSNATPAGQNSGVGFAAPIHLIQSNLALLASGKDVPLIKTPFLGIQGDTSSSEDQKGVIINAVLPDTAAEKAGLKAKDKILIFNGVEVNDFLTLAEEIQRLGVGDKIIITVDREGWQRELTIVLGARPEGQ